ncbi:MAG: cysteine protease, partial [Bacteroidetes bacterium]|nr:cysteine protease [Bacteroidota bacterium]
FDSSISPALTYSNNQVAIPSEEKHIRLDSNPGTDYMCLLYARSPLKIEEIKSKVKTGSGSFEERVKAALGKQLIELGEVNLHRDEIGFEAKSMWGEVVAVFLELEHR